MRAHQRHGLSLISPESMAYSTYSKVPHRGLRRLRATPGACASTCFSAVLGSSRVIFEIGRTFKRGVRSFSIFPAARPDGCWPQVRAARCIPVGTDGAEAAFDPLQPRLDAALTFIAPSLDRGDALGAKLGRLGMRVPRAVHTRPGRGKEVPAIEGLF